MDVLNPIDSPEKDEFWVWADHFRSGAGHARSAKETSAERPLADLIIAALNRHQRTLSEIIDDCLTENQRANLDNLLEKEPISGTEEGWRFPHIAEEAISIHPASENQSKSGRLRYRADTLS